MCKVWIEFFGFEDFFFFLERKKSLLLIFKNLIYCLLKKVVFIFPPTFLFKIIQVSDLVILKHILSGILVFKIILTLLKKPDVEKSLK